jgi:hypothetical protein
MSGRLKAPATPAIERRFQLQTNTGTATKVIKLSFLFSRPCLAIAMIALIGCGQAVKEKTPEDIQKVQSELKSRSNRELTGK